MTINLRGAVAGDRRPLFPFPALGTWDKALAVVSAGKAATLPLRYLATGHGDILRNPVALLAAAIARTAAQGAT